MPQITEFAWFPLKAGTENSEAAASLKKLSPQLHSQPGLEGSWQGAPLERPQSAEIVNGIITLPSEYLRSNLTKDLTRRSLGVRGRVQGVQVVAPACRGPRARWRAGRPLRPSDTAVPPRRRA